MEDRVKKTAKNNYTIYSQGDQQILIGGEWINLCAPLL